MKCSRRAVSVICCHQFLSMTPNSTKLHSNVSTKFSQMVPISWIRWPPQQKNRKIFKRHLLLGLLHDFKIISKDFSEFLLHPFSKIAIFGSARLKKMATKAQNREIFKQHLLLGQWPNFKIISKKCSSYTPLQKLLKWFYLAEQNGHQSHK